MPLEVVTGGDENYAWGIVAAMRSVRLHTRSPVSFTILDLGLSQSTYRRLERAVPSWGGDTTLRKLKPSLADFAGLPTPAHFSTANYARLLLPGLLRAASVLYLDADVLVRSDVGDLISQANDSGAATSAARDYAYPTMEMGLPHESRRGGPRVAQQSYFNSGVMVMDLDQWRRNDLSRKVLSWLTRHPDEVRFVDQDGINAALNGGIYELSPVWNVQAGPAHALLRDPQDVRRQHLSMRIEEVLANPAIVHFVGGKPWAGQGFQANSASARANLEWWSALCSAGVYPSRAIAYKAREALEAAGRQAIKQARTGRVATRIRARGSVGQS